jgi:hypothetical protein
VHGVRAGVAPVLIRYASVFTISLLAVAAKHNSLHQGTATSRHDLDSVASEDACVDGIQERHTNQWSRACADE